MMKKGQEEGAKKMIESEDRLFEKSTISKTCPTNLCQTLQMSKGQEHRFKKKRTLLTIIPVRVNLETAREAKKVSRILKK